MKRLALCALLALSACQTQTPDEESPGPITQVETVVNGVSYAVDLGLVYEGRAGDIYISEYGHPELAGAETLARDIAYQACTEAGRIFDNSVTPIPQAKASWFFAEVCR